MQTQDEAAASASASTTEESQSNSELIKKLLSVLSEEDFLFPEKYYGKGYKRMPTKLIEIMAAIIKNLGGSTKKNINLDSLSYEFQESKEGLARICRRLGLNEQISIEILKELLYEMEGENESGPGQVRSGQVRSENESGPVEKSKKTPMEEKRKQHERVKKVVAIKKYFVDIICCQMQIGILKLPSQSATRATKTHAHLEMKILRRKIKGIVNELLQLLGEPTTSQMFGSENKTKGKKNTGKK